MSFTIQINGTKLTYDKKISILDIIGDSDPNKEIVCCLVNNRLRELTYEVYYDAKIELLGVDNLRATSIYEASLRYLIAMAFKRAYPDLEIKYSSSICRSLQIHLLTPTYQANEEMLEKIKKEIDKIIEEDLPLVRRIVSKKEAEQIYKERGYLDKLEILKYRPEKTVHLYSCDEYENYMYSHMVPSTGYLKKYRIALYEPGFLLSYPRAELKGEIPPFEDTPTFHKMLDESFLWGASVGCHTVASINKYIEEKGTIELINIAEARHNRMLCELGQLIESRINDIKLICIAGPSSSGKTTFANRLRVELLSRGISPIRISLDDYYFPKDKIPLDEEGKPDFESIDGLNIDQFNKDMLNLIKGETVTLRRFDFKKGEVVSGRTISLGKNQPLIIEGIHALNERMTRDIPKNQKFKIFISPQQQINLDNHNPLNMTELRLVRRIVRDKRDRNSSCSETIQMWPSVRRGEFKWIYPSLEGADYVYNSMMPFEFAIMKKYIQKELSNIEKESEDFPLAERLLRLLKYFVDMDDEWVPSNSLMREFIGGSCYADV